MTSYIGEAIDQLTTGNPIPDVTNRYYPINTGDIKNPYLVHVVAAARDVSTGPVWCAIRYAQNFKSLLTLATGMIRGDSNYAESDCLFWHGRLALPAAYNTPYGNLLYLQMRNDSNTTPFVYRIRYEVSD